MPARGGAGRSGADAGTDRQHRTALDLHARGSVLRARGCPHRGRAGGGHGRLRGLRLCRPRCRPVRHHLGSSPAYRGRPRGAALRDPAHGAGLRAGAQHRAARLGAELFQAAGRAESGAWLGAAGRPGAGARGGLRAVAALGPARLPPERGKGGRPRLRDRPCRAGGGPRPRQPHAGADGGRAGGHAGGQGLRDGARSRHRRASAAAGPRLREGLER